MAKNKGKGSRKGLRRRVEGIVDRVMGISRRFKRMMEETLSGFDLTWGEYQVLGALRSALTAKLRDGELKVVQSFALTDHKTKGFRAALNRLETSRKVLVVDNGENRNLSLSSRNLEGVTLVPTRDVSVYHLLGHDRVLLSQDAAAKLSEALAR